MLLKDKIVVVTGAANGIGRASAVRLAQEGADLAILDREGDALKETGDAVRKLGRRCHEVVLDMTDYQKVEAAFAGIKRELGDPDVLVNNVGGSLRERAGSFWKIDPSTWDEMLGLCLKPALGCCYLVIDGMIAKGGGKIVNVGSDSAIVGSRGNAAYASAKGGIIGLTRSLARELAPHRINVNCVAPGYIATRANLAVPAEMVKKAIAETPLGFMGEPEDIANVVAFLATDQSRYMTGQTLVANGGRSFN
jgi:acetoacetyl-CoA reductase/3-oxoacyl-[acyl-carrier protein] reductase